MAATEGLQKGWEGAWALSIHLGKWGACMAMSGVCPHSYLLYLFFLNFQYALNLKGWILHFFACLVWKFLETKVKVQWEGRKSTNMELLSPAVVLGTGKQCGEAMESWREIRHWEHVTDDRENDERARIEVQMAGASGAYGHCRPVALRLLTVLRLLKLPKHILSDNFVCAKGHMILFFSVNVPLIWLFLVSGWGCGR